MFLWGDFVKLFVASMAGCFLLFSASSQSAEPHDISGCMPPAETPTSYPGLPLMPWPAQINLIGEKIVASGFAVSFKGYWEARLERAKRRFLSELKREGKLQASDRGRRAQLVIHTGGPSKPVQELGEAESYSLEIVQGKVVLSAANPLGVLRGLQTLRQLAEPEKNGLSLPAGTISDKPRFSWRGLLIDPPRRFIPVESVKRTLDGMEEVKLNVFHLHLTDDPGFRIESKKFPKLHELGSDGHFYSQAQMRDIIAYARDRGIRVIPEFDMPAHAISFFAGYPELASGPGPYTPVPYGDGVVDPSRESTYDFLDRFIGEMGELFPDAYFHIGGDECGGKQWDANASIHKFMQDHGLKNNTELQAYFTERVQALVVKHGKIPAGWDEILQPNTPKEVVIQSWRGTASLADGARRGYFGILSTGYYIDLNQSAAEHYAIDPLGGEAASLTSEEQRRILGGETTMWGEFVDDENIDSRIWPRSAAIAERFWSNQNMTDADFMYQRLDRISHQLESLGLRHLSSYPKMLKELAAGGDMKSLRVLGDVLQPQEGFRGSMGDYSCLTPLNRLVDAIPPESPTVREFSKLADRLGKRKAVPGDFEEANRQLELWRDNDVRLQPTLAKTPQTQELIPISANLSHTAVIGLAALNAIETHRSVTQAWVDESLAFLKDAGKPQALVVNKIVEPVAVLVKASATPAVASN